MLFLLRLATFVVVALLAAVSQGWTAPYFLKLGAMAAAAFTVTALILLWVTRTRLIEGIRIPPNPLREVILGATAGLGWIVAMTVFYIVVKGTPGLPETIVDRDRSEMTKVVSLLEKDNNWSAAAKVLVDSLEISHTPGFTLELAERAVIDLTRAAEQSDAHAANNFLDQAISIADKHGLPDDFPRTVRSHLTQRTSIDVLERRAGDAESKLKDATADNKDLKLKNESVQNQLATLSDSAAARIAADARQATELRLTLATALCKAAYDPDLSAARAHFTKEIVAAKAQGVSVADAETALSALDAALAAVSPGALPPGATARIMRIHDSPMPGLLLVDVQVTDPAGRPIVGLSSKDFVTRQGVRALRVAASPFSQSGTLNVEVLVDKSGSMDGAPIRAAVAAVVDLFRRLPAATQVRAASFSDRVSLLTDWTSDTSRAIAACQGLRAEGGTALFAATYEGISALAAMPGERYLIVLSDGANSVPGPSKEAIVAAAKRAHVSIHFVALKAVGYDDTSVIESIAAQTGGQTLLVENASGLVAKFRSLADMLAVTCYRVALLDHDAAQAAVITIGGDNSVELTVAPQGTSSAVAQQPVP